MESFRNPKYVERYEDVVFDLETPLKTTIANDAHQIKTGYRFVADNSGEVAPFDWYNSRLMIDFKVVLLADGGDIAVDDHNGIVNDSHSFIQDIDIKTNGLQLYECNQSNQVVNIKSLLEYNREYMESTGTNHNYYLDNNRHAEERPAQVATYNEGFAARKLLLGTSATVNTEIPLNRYSFFESLEDELLPNMKIEIVLAIESDGSLIWQAGADCRVVITNIQLFVPRIIFNSQGQTQYMRKYLKPHKWTYLREIIERGNSTQQQTGSFKISSGINRPRHVFVWISNDANQENQTANPFLYNFFCG